MFKVAIILLGMFTIGCGTLVQAADDQKSTPYVGKVMVETIVFFPKEFDQFDDKVKNDMKEAMKKTGAVDCADGLRMPMRPLRGAWIQVGSKRVMMDANGVFTISSLPPDTTELSIFQQLSDRTPMAKFPTKRLSHKGEKVEPFIISIRAPFGECHSGKVDHTN
jgi:hypothetical protein